MIARRVVIVVLTVGAGLGAAGCSGSDPSSAPSDPASRAATVMGVRRDLVHYRIDLLPDGGALTVTVDDPFAAQEIGRIGDYLHTQQRRLGAGDVTGLRALLGPDTPGLEALAAAPEALKRGYVELPDGGRIEIRSDRPAQVTAIHQLLNSVLVRFGTRASAGVDEPDTTTTTTAPAPAAPDGFLG